MNIVLGHTIKNTQHVIGIAIYNHLFEERDSLVHSTQMKRNFFYHIIMNYCISVGSCLTIIFTFRYGIVHFKYFSRAIFCE